MIPNTKRSIITLALSLLLAAAISFASASGGASTLLFEDNFDGATLNPVWNPYICGNPSGWPWNYEIGQPKPSSAIGKPNGKYADYDWPSNISTGVDGLCLADRSGSSATGYSWTGGVVCSHPTKNIFGEHRGYSFADAYIEVRAKMPYTGNGSWPAIWFLAAPGSSGAEIDLYEGGFLDGSISPDHVMACNLQTPGNTQKLVDTGTSLSSAFHRYGMDYRQGKSVKFYFDGSLVATYTTNVPTGAYYIILNNGVATSRTSYWHTTGTPASPNFVRVSYVRVYDSPPWL